MNKLRVSAEPTEQQKERLTNDLKGIAKDTIINLHFFTPKEFSVTVKTELGALRIAYEYRNSKKVTVRKAPNVAGWNTHIEN